MNRARRISTRGWLGSALSALTFGYYPSTDIVTSFVYGSIEGPQTAGALTGALGDGSIEGAQGSGAMSGPQSASKVFGPQTTGVLVWH